MSDMSIIEEKTTLNKDIIEKLKFDDKGLIPAIVADFFTKEVLMLAYMNRESLDISLSEGYTCFFSRSRSKLWRKGEESGNKQKIISISADCDLDTLIVKVIPAGPACHTGEQSCFFNLLSTLDKYDEFSIYQLFNMLVGRNETRPENSYTTYLFEKGEDKILKKIGEESTEVVVASKNNDKQETIYEISDLIYHLLVLMVHKEISLDDIQIELSKRNVVDKKVKQETMK